MIAAATPASRTYPPRRRRHGALAAVAVLGCAAASAADPQSLNASAPAATLHVGSTMADFLAEASQRSGIPEDWIVAVMRAESAFDPHATSPKGAMGLMQLMPDTWAALRARLGLGIDPYDPRDNILAGASYLRDLYDQFGAGGFLAAYNAGPGRYLDFLTRGRPLPDETRAYVAKIGAAIAGGPAIPPLARTPATALPPRPGVFVALAGPRTVATAAASPPSVDEPIASPFDPTTSAGALFVDASGKAFR